MQNKRSNPSRRGRASDYQDRSSSGSNESNGYVRRDPFDPSAYSRKSAFSRDEYTRESSTARRVAQRDYAKERVRRKRKKTIAVAIAVVAVLCLGGAAAAYAYYHVLDSNLHEGVTEELRGKLVETDLAKEPFYMLLMGTDGSNDREASEEFAGDQFRSDSIMLARIDPVDKKVTLVSLHRDTLVDMGEEYGRISSMLHTHSAARRFPSKSFRSLPVFPSRIMPRSISMDSKTSLMHLAVLR